MARVAEEDVLNLSGKAWGPLPRLARTIPFGYVVSEDDPEILEPVLFELEALERAKLYKQKGYSYRKVRAWLVEVTGREISVTGLQKRIESDARRRSKAQALAEWARKYKEAFEKAKANDERLGNDTSEYDEALASLDRISANRT